MTSIQTADTTGGFITPAIIYLLTFIVFSLLLYQQSPTSPENRLGFEETVDIKKTNITADLIDQLKENKARYENNVWTTLGTIIGALGMVLGSLKFQQLLKSGKLSVSAIQATLFLLYALHAASYYFYRNENLLLMEQLESVVVAIKYYGGYEITQITVIVNMAFDTILFLLLAYIVGRVGEAGEEEK